MAGKTPKQKNSSPPLIKIALITDIHYGFDTGARLGSKAPRLMNAFNKAAQAYQPDFIVDMGDRVSGRNARLDHHYMTVLQKHFQGLSAPVHHLIGNHDEKHLSRADNEHITGSPSHSWSMDHGDFHFIFWNPEIQRHGTGLSATQGDLHWLENDLASTEKKTVLFSHIPFDHEPKEENPHEHIALRFHHADSHAIRKILEDSEKVKLCLSGHVHRNHKSEINGIHYISQQSLTQTYKKLYRVPAAAWAWLEIHDDRIVHRLRGKVQKDYTLALL